MYADLHVGSLNNTLFLVALYFSDLLELVTIPSSGCEVGFEKRAQHHLLSYIFLKQKEKRKKVNLILILIDIDIGKCRITKGVAQFLEFKKLGLGQPMFSLKSCEKGIKKYLPHNIYTGQGQL